MQIKSVKQYKLRQPPKKPIAWGHLLISAICMGYLIWLVLINPLLTWEFNVEGSVNQLEYGLLTAGAFIFAGLAMIPVIRNDRKHEYALNMIWFNRNYLLHEETQMMYKKLVYHVWRKGNADEVVAEIQHLVNKHGGKDMRVKQYGLNKDYAHDLEEQK